MAWCRLSSWPISVWPTAVSRFLWPIPGKAWLEQQCREKPVQRPHPDQGSRTIGQVFAEEQAQLRPVGKPFAGYVEKACRATATCTVGYDRNRYSVPAEYAGQGVFLRATAIRIKIVQEPAMSAALARSSRSSIPGITCPCWSASPVPCAMAPPLCCGTCPHRCARSGIICSSRTRATAPLSRSCWP